MNKQNNLLKPTLLLAIITGGLLLIPLAATYFTDEVVWTLEDFVFAGVLLFGCGFAYLLATRKTSSLIYKIAIGMALFSGLSLIWVNGAVGIVGSESNPANFMYFGVILVGLIGAFITRFESEGMMFTLFAMAFAQTLIAVVILVGEMYQSPPASVVEIVGVNGLFVTLFSVAALLFRKAAEGEPALEDTVKHQS